MLGFLGTALFRFWKISMKYGVRMKLFLKNSIQHVNGSLIDSDPSGQSTRPASMTSHSIDDVTLDLLAFGQSPASSLPPLPSLCPFLPPLF